MAVKMRLTRMGTRKKPYYRIVVADSVSPRDGKFIEIVGSYDPKKDPAEITVKEDRVREWLSRGVEPTLTVSQLLGKKGITIAKGRTKVA
ncbi:MAG: 30S ribosomal protein S16 [Pseudomonadota bacterium]|jgi:small subunit ribosomal protein S16|nr:30S ribosomal protein S16 [Syntrophaceae bacterium]MDI9554318.1 30S ribosomal protein S16 [Pseudomonadota bacterium]NLX30230.1 30S ribosomal protein S16 [Deltaproteobacteria bacterium]HNU84696.1 30S ribosomal protein S16 [Syntrophales bacterium]HNZ33971.1 30S ribosomal protein S16 [Syntrophales bacterium]